MSEAIYWELYYIRDCFLWGIFLSLLYDAIRVIRIVFPHGSVIVAVEDFFYWTFAAIGMFSILYREDDGTIRWFAIAAAFLAMLLMNCCISKYTVPWIGNLLAAPLRFLTKIVRKSIQKMKKRVCKRLKSIQKQFTIEVARRREDKKQSAGEKQKKGREKRGRKESVQNTLAEKKAEK